MLVQCEQVVLQVGADAALAAAQRGVGEARLGEG